jgi:hypothetical protein
VASKTRTPPSSTTTTRRCSTPSSTSPPDPDPTIKAGLDDPIEDDPQDEEFEFTRPGHKLTPEQARAALLDQITAWIDQGREDFQTKDLAEVWLSAGMTRQWAQGQIRKLRDAGVIGYDDQAQRHTLINRPEAAYA